MVVKHSTELMEWFCGYVKLPSDHPYAKLTKKRSWTDLGFMLWKARKKLGRKPKSCRRYMHTGYDKMDIEVHGGLTFSEYYNEPKGIFPIGAWIGWDYLHLGDAMYMQEKDIAPKDLKMYREIMKMQARYPLTIPEKRWTGKEVERECKKVINQLLKV